MILLAIIAVLLLICFAGILLVGAPYLPTLKPQMYVAIELAGLKPGQTMLELGCGDGRVLIAAAQKGYNAVGYELNPLLAAVAWLRTRPYRSQVRVVWGDFWRVEWPRADAVFTFLLPRYMHKLDQKCADYPHKPLRLVSFAFQVPDKKPGRHRSGVFVYDYA